MPPLSVGLNHTTPGRRFPPPALRVRVLGEVWRGPEVQGSRPGARCHRRRRRRRFLVLSGGRTRERWIGTSVPVVSSHVH